MKRILYTIYTLLGVALMFSSCETERTVYSGPSYVGFSDTLQICPVMQDAEPYKLAVAATASCDYDRTYGVEVIPSESNAVYGKHFEFVTSNVTIKAGETVGYLEVSGIFDNIEAGDSLRVGLRLASMNQEDNWDLYGQETALQFVKIYPFNLRDFIRCDQNDEEGEYGYCITTSSFLMEYNPFGLPMERLCKTRIVDEENNIIKIEGLLFDGLDATFKLDNSDPLNPKFNLTEEQVIGDCRQAFGTIHGNGDILGKTTQGAPSTFDVGEHFAVEYVDMRVEGVGIVGTFVNLMEWVTAEDAEDFLENYN